MKSRKRIVRKDRSPKEHRRPEVRPAEQILIDALDEFPAGQILCTSMGRGQLAAEAARRHPSAAVCCWFLDLYACEQARSPQYDLPSNVRFECRSDLPPDEIDAFATPVAASGEAELARDLIQSAHGLLRIGGTLFASIQNPDDSWLREQLRTMFDKVTRRKADHGVLYIARKTEPLRRVRNFACQFAFRDEGRLISAFSRPGVFSHRRVDGGARAMLRSLIVRPGDRVLDIGCGSGVVSLAAALRAEGVWVQAVDSNARAVECARRGAECNRIESVAVSLQLADAPAASAQGGSYDLVVANPPYYSNDRLSAVFAQCARGAVRAGGTVLFVTKRVDWYREHFPRLFDSVTFEPVGDYQVVRAVG